MIWTLLNLQLFLTQLLQDLWTTALTRTPFKDLTMQDLICGSRGPSTIRVQMKLISLLSFSTLFYILMTLFPLRFKQPPTWGLPPLVLTGLSPSL